MHDDPPTGHPPARPPRPAALPAPAHLGDGWSRCLALMLDEIDHGLLLLDGSGQVRLLNRRAGAELDRHQPLQVDAGHLRARRREDQAALADALATAGPGQRRLLALGQGDERISVAVVALGADALDGGPATMLLLGRRPLDDAPILQAFARLHRLTPAETRVLGQLCAGMAPTAIATRLGVRISTVRSQIGGLRAKTGCSSIVAVVRRVGLLPPMVPAPRGRGAGQGLVADTPTGDLHGTGVGAGE